MSFEGDGAWDAFQNLCLGYTGSLGNPELRHAIAGLYRGIKPDEILVISGAGEAIFIIAAWNTIKRNTRVICPP
ncbi:hypothetical protein [Desulfotruncus alcoholivorax]|uniref:hypothetical protein n=1 Tax=Desulfotruncus alcoholivorax TaxID=265477 RepID=UPI000407DA12|nr:hypothetical protein [Desulfotruncus alcoholivorax]